MDCHDSGVCPNLAIMGADSSLQVGATSQAIQTYRHTEPLGEVSILATFGFKSDLLTLGESKGESFDSLLRH